MSSVYSHFFSKKIQHICLSLDANFNELLTNDIVSFEQLGPACKRCWFLKYLKASLYFIYVYLHTKCYSSVNIHLCITVPNILFISNTLLGLSLALCNCSSRALLFGRFRHMFPVPLWIWLHNFVWYRYRVFVLLNVMFLTHLNFTKLISFCISMYVFVTRVL